MKKRYPNKRLGLVLRVQSGTVVEHRKTLLDPGEEMDLDGAMDALMLTGEAYVLADFDWKEIRNGYERHERLNRLRLERLYRGIP